MIFQNFNLMQRKNVFDNVAFPLETWGIIKITFKLKLWNFLN